MSESLPVASEPEWAAFAAIDWAGQKNFWRLVPTGSQHQEQGNWRIPRKRWRCGLRPYSSVLAADISGFQTPSPRDFKGVSNGYE